MPDDRLTPEELAAVQARYPVSKDVANLSLGVSKNATGMIPASCEVGPEINTGRAQGILSHEPATTNFRSTRKARGKANLRVENPGPSAFVERAARYAALVAAQAERWGTKRFLVRVTSIRKNLLDEDNLCEKYHVDCVRYSGIIPSDDPGKTHIEVRQQKADPGSAEETLIEVFEL